MAQVQTACWPYVFRANHVKEEGGKVRKTFYDRYEAYIIRKTNDSQLLVKDFVNANGKDMIRDCIVFGINLPVEKERLVNVGSELTLDKAVDIAR